MKKKAKTGLNSEEGECIKAFYNQYNDDAYQYPNLSDRTVMYWYCEFRNRNGASINHPLRRKLWEKLPPIFHQNPDLKEKLLSFGKSNLAAPLTAEVMHHYVLNTMILEFVEEIKKEMSDVTKEQVLKKYQVIQIVRTHRLQLDGGAWFQISSAKKNLLC